MHPRVWWAVAVAALVASAPAPAATLRETVVLVSGEVRSLHITAASIVADLVQPLDADVVVCTFEPTHPALVHFARTLRAAGRLVALDETVPQLPSSRTLVPLQTPHVCASHGGCAGAANGSAYAATRADAAVDPPPAAFRRFSARFVTRENQFLGLDACIARLAEHETRRGAPYRWVVRQRFDVAYWGTWAWPRELAPRTFYMPRPCRYPFTAAGVNDRVWVSDRATADIAFSTLLFNNLVARSHEPGAGLAERGWCAAPRVRAQYSPEPAIGDHLRHHGIAFADLDVAYAILLANGTLKYAGAKMSGCEEADLRARALDPARYVVAPA